MLCVAASCLYREVRNLMKHRHHRARCRCCCVMCSVRLFIGTGPTERMSTQHSKVSPPSGAFCRRVAFQFVVVLIILMSYHQNVDFAIKLIHFLQMSTHVRIKNFQFKLKAYFEAVYDKENRRVAELAPNPSWNTYGARWLESLEWIFCCPASGSG